MECPAVRGLRDMCCCCYYPVAVSNPTPFYVLLFFDCTLLPRSLLLQITHLSSCSQSVNLFHDNMFCGPSFISLPVLMRRKT